MDDEKERIIIQLPPSSDEEEDEEQMSIKPPSTKPPPPPKYAKLSKEEAKLSKEEAARRDAFLLLMMSTEDFTATTTKAATATKTKTKKTPILKRSVSAVATRKYWFHNWIAKSRARQIRIKELHEELRDSEKQFSQGLLFIETNFVEKLRKDKILSVQEITALFGPWSKLRKAHERFTNRLESLSTEKSLQTRQLTLANEFLEHVNRIREPLGRFVADYYNNTMLINELLQKNEKFKQLCDRIRKKKSLGLSSYLISVVQRAPKYIVMVRQISKLSVSDDQVHLSHLSSELESLSGYCDDLVST